MSHLTNSPAWLALQRHYSVAKDWHMRDLFANNPQRASEYTIKAANISLDYSKNIINQQTLKHLEALLLQQSFSTWREKLFTGAKINHTENRSVLHTALRQQNTSDIPLDGENIALAIRETRQRIYNFTADIHQHKWLGYSGKSIKSIVNIGIGGSNLGPEMVINALKDYHSGDLQVHFVSNIDPDEITDVLEQCDPERTLFVVVSKTFTTIETLHNAEIAKAWLFDNGLSEKDLMQHFCAVTSDVVKAQEFGISTEAIFPIWNWVGGRFSLWSAAGLSIVLAIGIDHFNALLSGAYEMDEHFRQAEPLKNLPVIIALLGVWYNNFFNAHTVAVLPYSKRLAHLPRYLQQVDMESNGKSVDRDGVDVDYQTGPIIWGEPGTNGQHAFYQLIHQGTKLVPCDFIGVKHHKSDKKVTQTLLNANYIAQMEALMLGKSVNEASTAYQAFAGNKPSNAIVLEKLTPQSLGSLIAMYEHKIFVQGVIWNINSYDQWGVEYGKQLARQVYADMCESHTISTNHDCSTESLIRQLSE